jgi:hypothetical protein
MSVAALLVTLLLAGLMIWNSTPRETVTATVVDAHFVQERGPDGHTRVTLQTADGRTLTAKRPGRHAWKAGDAVTTEIAGSRVLRIHAADAGPRAS